MINTSVDSSFSRPFDSVGGGFSVGGVRGSNEMLVDGVPNNTSAAGGPSAYSPPQDAVTEVRVSAFESDAAYGHAGGGTINLVTKSGTNAFHFTASEYNQVSYLEANAFFYNKASKARPTFNYNQYGLTAGGPLYIPKLFNGKNRVFWMFAFEGLRDGAPSEDGVYLATVPTAARRQGDFSELLKAGSAYQIYDPRTGVLQGAQVARTPFPGNIIPKDRLSPVALKYLDFYPQASGPGRADGFQNYFVDAVDTNTYDNEIGRLDLNLSDKSKLSFQVRNSARSQNKRNYFHNLSTGNYLFRNNHGLSLDEVYSISPTVMMNTEKGVRLKSTRGRGGVLENLRFDNWTMENAAEGIHVTNYYTKTAEEPVSERTPIFRNVAISNMTIKDSHTVINIEGLPEMPVNGLRISDVIGSGHLGMKAYNTIGLELHNVQVNAETGPAFLIKDSKDLELDGVTTRKPLAGFPVIRLDNSSGAIIRSQGDGRYGHVPVDSPGRGQERDDGWKRTRRREESLRGEHAGTRLLEGGGACAIGRLPRRARTRRSRRSRRTRRAGWSSIETELTFHSTEFSADRNLSAASRTNQ